LHFFKRGYVESGTSEQSLQEVWACEKAAYGYRLPGLRVDPQSALPVESVFSVGAGEVESVIQRREAVDCKEKTERSRHLRPHGGFAEVGSVEDPRHLHRLEEVFPGLTAALEALEE
jgi:hypothetical protein